MASRQCMLAKEIFFNGSIANCQKRQNFSPSKICAIRYIKFKTVLYFSYNTARCEECYTSKSLIESEISA